MKNKEFWKGTLAGGLVVAVLGTGVFYGVNYTGGKSVLSDRKCTVKLAALEKIIDESYLGDKDQEKLKEGLYTGLIYGLDDPYSRYYTAEEYEEENTSNQGTYQGIGISMEKNLSLIHISEPTRQRT